MVAVPYTVHENTIEQHLSAVYWADSEQLEVAIGDDQLMLVDNVGSFEDAEKRLVDLMGEVGRVMTIEWVD